MKATGLEHAFSMPVTPFVTQKPGVVPLLSHIVLLLSHTGLWKGRCLIMHRTGGGGSELQTAIRGYTCRTTFFLMLKSFWSKKIINALNKSRLHHVLILLRSQTRCTSSHQSPTTSLMTHTLRGRCIDLSDSLSLCCFISHFSFSFLSLHYDTLKHVS